MLGRRRSRGARLALALAFAWACAVVRPAAQELFFALAAKPGDFEATLLDAGSVRLELPKHNWRLRTDENGALLTATERRNEAAMRLERSELEQSLEPENVTELFGELERERVASLQPEASEFDVRLFRVGERRVVVVQYLRPGPRGPERVRQYSYPEGRTLYRLVCTAPVSRFARHEAVFAHAALSLAPVGSS
jgi:hypothetical protein